MRSCNAKLTYPLKTISLFIISCIVSLDSYCQFRDIGDMKKAVAFLQDQELMLHANYLWLPDDEKPDLLFPCIYSMSIMTVNIAALIISGYALNPPSFSQFRQAYTAPPVFDKDHWSINYVSHPLMGSETYLRAREHHFGPFGSFLFSTAASLSWEYLIESWTEPPSIQDLLVTSTSGSLLGELRYKAKKKMNPKHHWIIDPIHSAYLAIRKKGNDKQMVFSICISL